jgi:hypothetical protein
MRYFTNPLTIEAFNEQFSSENWPLAFSCGQDQCDSKHYAVTTDHVNASRTDPVCAAELAMLFSKSNKMYNLIKDVVEHHEYNQTFERDEDIKEMNELIKKLETEIEKHRREN